MALDILRLAGVVEAFNEARARPSLSKANALALIHDDLRALAAQALDEDLEIIPLVVGLIHLLVDFRDGSIPENAGHEALQALEKHLSQGWPPTDWSSWMAPWVLHGDPIQAGPGTLGPKGSTLLRWGAFCDYSAASYSKSKFSPDDRNRLWERVRHGRIEVLLKDLHLDGANGVVWFTDYDEICRDCPPGKGQNGIDASRAYDSLGLDWSQNWEDNDRQGGGSGRAILLSVSLERRSRAAGGVRAPTALDGWGCLIFVPGNVPRGGRWPEVGSFTVDPLTGRRCLPEGIHGPLDVLSGATCPIEECGTVSKRIADRLTECGDKIVENALRRL